MRRRCGSAAIVLTLTLGVALSGCTASVTPPPLSSIDRARVRTELLDQLWARVRVQYPGTLRPEIGSTLLVDDRDWADDVSDCMQSQGFTVSRENEDSPYVGLAPQAYAVADYTCSAQFVTAGTISTLLDPDEYEALRSYYVGYVRPCLLAAGARSAPPPVETGDVPDVSARGWSPYQQIWASPLSSDAVHYLERRCPPVPGWLHLSTD